MSGVAPGALAASDSSGTPILVRCENLLSYRGQLDDFGSGPSGEWLEHGYLLLHAADSAAWHGTMQPVSDCPNPHVWSRVRSVDLTERDGGLGATVDVLLGRRSPHVDAVVSLAADHVPAGRRSNLSWLRGGRERLGPHPHRLTLALAPTAAWSWRLQLDSVVGTGERRQPIEVLIESAPGGISEARSPKWNRAGHVVRLLDEVVRPGQDAQLSFELDPHADPWVRPPAAQRSQVLTGKLRLDADGRASGSWSSLDGRSGTLVGSVTPLLRGTWQLEGYEGPRQGVAWAARHPIHSDQEVAPPTLLPPIRDPREGPFATDTPIQAADDQGLLMPAGDATDQTWFWISGWQWAVAADQSRVPRFGAPPSALAWAAAAPLMKPGATLPAAATPSVADDGVTRLLWHLKATLRLPTAGQVGLAWPQSPLGAAWVNSQQIWAGDRDQVGALSHTTVVDLPAGDHEVVLRFGIELEMPQNNREFTRQWTARMDLVNGGLAIRWQADEVETGWVVPEPFVRDPAQARPGGGRPLVWDASEADGQVAWRQSLASPVVSMQPLNDNVVVLLHDGTLGLIGVADGRWLWQQPTGIEHGLVTAGENDIVVCGTVEAASFTFSGALRWRQPLDAAAIDDMGIPRRLLLVGDAVIVARQDRDPERRGATDHVVALARADGAHRWHLSGLRADFGLVREPIDGPDRPGVLVSANGQVVDPSTGVILLRAINTRPSGFAGIPGIRSDCVSDGRGLVVFATGHGISGNGDWVVRRGWRAGVALWRTATGGLAHRTLWRASGPSWYDGATAIAEDLVIRAAPTHEHHAHRPLPWVNVHVYDAPSGELLATLKPAMDDSLHPENLLTIDGLAVLVDGGGRKTFVPETRARLTMIALGDRPATLATNLAPDGLRQVLPVSKGWLLGGEELWYVAPGNAEAKAREARALLQYQLLHVGSPPRLPDPLRIEPLPGTGDDEDALILGVGPQRWWLRGPDSTETRLLSGEELLTDTVAAVRTALGRTYREVRSVDALRLPADGEIFARFVNDRTALARLTASGPIKTISINGQTVTAETVIEFMPGIYQLTITLQRPREVPVRIQQRMQMPLRVQFLPMEAVPSRWAERIAGSLDLLRTLTDSDGEPLATVIAIHQRLNEIRAWTAKRACDLR